MTGERKLLMSFAIGKVTEVHNLSVGLTHLINFKAAPIASVPTFLFTQLATDKTLLAAAFAAAAAVLAALLTSLPALVREYYARKARKEDNQVAFLREQVNYHSRVVVLVRRSKHNALAHVQECHAHIDKLRELLRKAEVEPPEFHFQYYDELCGAEDRAHALLTLPPDIHTSLTSDGHKTR